MQGEAEDRSEGLDPQNKNRYQAEDRSEGLDPQNKNRYKDRRKTGAKG